MLALTLYIEPSVIQLSRITNYISLKCGAYLFYIFWSRSFPAVIYRVGWTYAQVITVRYIDIKTEAINVDIWYHGLVP